MGAALYLAPSSSGQDTTLSRWKHGFNSRWGHRAQPKSKLRVLHNTTNFMSKKYFFILFIIFLCFLAIKIIGHKSATIKGKRLFLEIADTPQKQSQGLAGHQSLNDNQAMLFSYSPPQQVSFWMKGMSFPIDIIYIANNQVVQIYSQVPAPSLSETNLKTYSSNQAVDYVLETAAGWTDRYKIEIGDKVILKL